MIYEPHQEKTNILHICENKGADQLRSNCEADQRLCFRYTASTIPLLVKSEEGGGLICAHAPILFLLSMVNSFLLTPIKCIYLEKHFRSQDSTLTYSIFVTIPALYFAYTFSLFPLLLTPLKPEFRKDSIWVTLIPFWLK